jgi:mRNA interferase HicA
MKRKDLLRHIEKHGCVFFREGKKHTVYSNPKNRQISTVPRHNEIEDFLARKICKDLDIPKIK